MVLSENFGLNRINIGVDLQAEYGKTNELLEFNKLTNFENEYVKEKLKDDVSI